jgi:hypothetical protein
VAVSDMLSAEFGRPFVVVMADGKAGWIRCAAWLAT